MYVDTFACRILHTADTITSSKNGMNDKGEIGSPCLLPSCAENQSPRVTDSVCTNNTTCSWIVRCSPAICLQVSRHRQAAICLQCLVGVYVVVWPAAKSSCRTSRSLPWFLSSWPTIIDELVSNMDDKLFNCITSDEHHVLHQLHPHERPDCGHSLRPRRHELCLTPKSRLDELNFVFRMLCNDMYWTLISCYLFLCICYY